MRPLALRLPATLSVLLLSMTGCATAVGAAPSPMTERSPALDHLRYPSVGQPWHISFARMHVGAPARTDLCNRVPAHLACQALAPGPPLIGRICPLPVWRRRALAHAEWASNDDPGLSIGLFTISKPAALSASGPAPSRPHS